MKIQSISKNKSHIVETDAEEWPTYERRGKDDWWQLMGSSWEIVYCGREVELEQMFQVWLMEEEE